MGREMVFGSSVGRKDARGLLTGKLFGIQRASDQTTMGLSRMSIACSDALGIVFMLTSGDNACLQGRSVKQVPEVWSRGAGLHSCTGTDQWSDLLLASPIIQRLKNCITRNGFLYKKKKMQNVACSFKLTSILLRLLCLSFKDICRSRRFKNTIFYVDFLNAWTMSQFFKNMNLNA